MKEIAEYVGIKYIEHQKVYDGINCPEYFKQFLRNGKFWFTDEDLNFKSNWNLLMPAIEKISAYRFEDGDTAYPRTFGMICEETGEFMFRFNRSELFSAPTLIEAAYMAVVDFINWFNEQKQ